VDVEGTRCLIGGNGAGKTTFINMVTGVPKPVSEPFTCAGRDITPLIPRDHPLDLPVVPIPSFRHARRQRTCSSPWYRGARGEEVCLSRDARTKLDAIADERWRVSAH
jgi:energy-coupling factor transporter ATP-binding protein EcfA2